MGWNAGPNCRKLRVSVEVAAEARLPPSQFAEALNSFQSAANEAAERKALVGRLTEEKSQILRPCDDSGVNYGEQELRGAEDGTGGNERFKAAE